MRPFLTSIIFLSMLSSKNSNAQDLDYNLDDGYIAKGYDVVSYFNGQPKEGVKEYMFQHKYAKLKFANRENLEAFKNNPEKFMPQYGGYCAWAIADKAKKVDIDPESYEIRDGKLYLFYDTIFADTLKKWQKNNPEKLRDEADRKWEKVKYDIDN